MCRLLLRVLFSVLFTATLFTGCDNQDTPVEPTQSAEPTVPADIRQYQDEAEQYERVISMMDPYVTQTKAGIYVFDESGFAANQAVLSAEEQAIVDELHSSIAIVNAEISKGHRESTIALGYYCNYYWWGHRCCYTGPTAAQLANALTGAGVSAVWFPYFGAVSAGLGSILQACYIAWDGFCLNGSWIGGFWITSP